MLSLILLEDDPSDAELIRLHLARGDLAIEWRLSTTEQEFRAAITASPPPDLILADYMLPGFDGLAALRIAAEIAPDLPFIFVSGSLGEERAIEALKSGATDYVLKDRLQRLPMVVKRALQEAKFRRERRMAQTALEQQRNLLGTLIDSLPDIVYAADRDGRVTITNRALLERLRRRRDQVIGRKLREIWDEEIVHDIESQSEAAAKTGRAHTESERAYVATDGTVSWFTFSHLPLREGNIVAGVVGICRDVTTRKVLEQEILDISNREQRRLGTDLHDGLGQELTGLSLLLKVVEGQLARDAPQFKADVTRLNDLLAQAISSTRSLARGLAPVDLDHGGLSEALGHLVSRCKHLYNVECVYLETGSKPPPFSEGAATHLYRVAQEALTNAARYARAKRITVELRVSSRKLHLSIADDGIGLTAGLARGQPGLGLKIMEYRARTLGGALEFDQSGGGTRVALSCPLNLLRQDRTKAAGAA